MRTAFNVAARAMALADGRAAIRTCCEYLAHGFSHRANGTTFVCSGGLIIRALSLLKIQTDKTFLHISAFGSGVHLYRLYRFFVRPSRAP